MATKEIARLRRGRRARHEGTALAPMEQHCCHVVGPARAKADGADAGKGGRTTCRGDISKDDGAGAGSLEARAALFCGSEFVCETAALFRGVVHGALRRRFGATTHRYDAGRTACRRLQISREATWVRGRACPRRPHHLGLRVSQGPASRKAEHRERERSQRHKHAETRFRYDRHVRARDLDVPRNRTNTRLYASLTAEYLQPPPRATTRNWAICTPCPSGSAAAGLLTTRIATSTAAQNGTSQHVKMTRPRGAGSRARPSPSPHTRGDPAGPTVRSCAAG